MKSAARGVVESPPSEPGTVHYSELPAGEPDSPLFQEWNTYRQEAGRLLAEGNEGKFVLIKNDLIVGIFETWDQAREAGLERYLRSPFLVHQIQTRERILRVRGYSLPWPN